MRILPKELKDGLVRNNSVRKSGISKKRMRRVREPKVQNKFLPSKEIPDIRNQHLLYNFKIKKLERTNF